MERASTAPLPRRVRVEVLHQFRLVLDGRDVRISDSAQHLVAWLAVEDRPRSRPTLAGTMWPDRTESDASSCLRRALWRLNRDAPGLLDCSSQQVTLSSGVEVDLREVGRLADSVQQGAPPVSNHAVRLLQGDLLPQWSFDWIEPYRESVRQVRLHALEGLARNDLDAGRPAGALFAALAAVGVDPLRESAQRIVIAAHLAEGNVAEALRQYAHFRDLLWDELRLRPGHQLDAMLPEAGGRLLRFEGRRGALSV